MTPASPADGVGMGSDERTPTTLLLVQLQRLGLDRSAPPDDRSWPSLLDGLEEACSAIAAADAGAFESILRSQVAQRRSSHTSLVDQSPVARLQFDMSSIGCERDANAARSAVRLTATNQAAATLLDRLQPRERHDRLRGMERRSDHPPAGLDAPPDGLGRFTRLFPTTSSSACSARSWSSWRDRSDPSRVSCRCPWRVGWPWQWVAT